ncbi:VOC family protein [Geodermatophilus marinus]|uniref:VOC family protein n=1 Tax=Geodermatophilus sp. LHW52908 TaxID=2303986 RepID=UPI000E3DD580|nr:VOC family protein [Geodermatophilus sp. LHW52908]RFU20584.1 VOC family protein [Geodermatophilus sp. LHW52908]
MADLLAPSWQPTALHHVRLTVTDITRSKAFYAQLLGVGPAIDFSDQAHDPAARQDPHRFFGGCTYALGSQLLGLRPSAPPGDRFDPTRIGLDHVSLAVDSPDALHQAADRLGSAGVEHGEVTELGELGIAILSVQDPDGINLELVATLPAPGDAG